MIAIENKTHDESIEKLSKMLKETEKAIEEWGTGNASYRII